MKRDNSKLVYSTDKKVPGKKKPGTHDQLIAAKSDHQKVIVRWERKGRGGKSVTIVDGLNMDQKSKMVFLKKLKAKLGTGGTIKDACFEFQGDHCRRLMAELQKMGHKPRRSGG